MGVNARSILNYQATDADHRAFAQGVHDMLIAAGLTQTADTGQANLATIARPNISATSGFEIFRFDDAEQASLPCLIRVEYGSSSSIVTIPSLRITFGQATNGAGVFGANGLTISGSSPVAYWDSAPDSVGASRPAFASYAEGQLFFGIGIDSLNGKGLYYYIGRPRAYDGSRTTDGLIGFIWTPSISTGRGRAVWRAGGGGPALFNSGASAPLSFIPDSVAGQDDQIGANVALFPIYFAVNGNLRFGSLFGYRIAAIAIDSQQSINVFGGLRNYRTMGAQMQYGQVAIAVPYF